MFIFHRIRRRLFSKLRIRRGKDMQHLLRTNLEDFSAGREEKTTKRPNAPFSHLSYFYLAFIKNLISGN
jgi:hypothetical protein